VVLDLDDFKQVNDRHGHAAGNEVLRQAGEILRHVARESDVAARYGGEELVLLVRGGEQSATAAAARFVQGVREVRFAGGLRVTCSAGVAARADGGDSAALFAAADDALYEAKRRGKDRVIVARAAPVELQRIRRTA
jgi:diguanylate cyclase (GGDEF)-like protein